MGHHYTAEFGGFRKCGSGDNTFLFCHVISQNHVIKKSFNFMNGSPLW